MGGCDKKGRDATFKLPTSSWAVSRRKRRLQPRRGKNRTALADHNKAFAHFRVVDEPTRVIYVVSRPVRFISTSQDRTHSQQLPRDRFHPNSRFFFCRFALFYPSRNFTMAAKISPKLPQQLHIAHICAAKPTVTEANVDISAARNTASESVDTHPPDTIGLIPQEQNSKQPSRIFQPGCGSLQVGAEPYRHGTARHPPGMSTFTDRVRTCSPVSDVASRLSRREASKAQSGTPVCGASRTRLRRSHGSIFNTTMTSTGANF